MARAEHENLLNEFYAALNSDDVDKAVELCGEDVEVWLNPNVVAAVAPRGQREVADYLHGWFDSWHAYSPNPEEYIESGDQVVAMVQLRARGKGSRFDIEEDMADVFQVSNGKIQRLRLYVDRKVALDFAGIPS
jgi:ketosteroid isomerase-like protein